MPVHRAFGGLRWRSAAVVAISAGAAGFGAAALSGVATSFSQPLATLLAGAGALGAGALAYLNGQRTRDLDVIHHKADLQRHQADADRERERHHADLERERERHQADTRRLREASLRDRYATVAGQIAHQSAAIRQAGVYALTALADDWHTLGEDDERQVCVNLLLWYLRVPFPEAADPRKPDRSEREIRQTIVRVLRRRRHWPVQDPKSWASTTIDMSHVSLPGCAFTALRFPDSTWTGADLTDTTLTNATLSHADLRHATLNRANLTSANLNGANLRDADLNNADLRDASLHGADLTGANLRGAMLTGADLIATTLTGAELTGATLTGAELTGAHFDDSTIWPTGFTPPINRADQ